MIDLVTGGAGFIGSHLCECLVRSGHQVIAVDNFDPFYDPACKWRNVGRLRACAGFHLIEADVRDHVAIARALRRLGVNRPDVIVHLAARAGVRPSIEDPILYAQVNLEGTVAVLELARHWRVRGLVFGSSSSVYGNNQKVPFSESDPVERPISPYAATKRAGELLCHAFHHLYDLSVVCLRFFTVYGPRQRPDLAIHKFTRLMLAGEPIPLFGDGSTARDYTYVDDIIAGIEKAMRYVREHERVFEIINLGGSRPASLIRLVELISAALELRPRIEWLPVQPGDVERTYADISRAVELLGYRCSTPLEQGIPRFCDWVREQERLTDDPPPPAQGSSLEVVTPSRR